MIVDTFENFKDYTALNEKFKIAFEYIQNTDFSKLNCGKYQIKNDDVYINIDEYETKLVSKPEYHKKYVDIQFLVSGEEKIGFTNIKNIVINEPFNEEKDIGFGVGNVDFVKMDNSNFMILFPNDAHQPCMAISRPQKVKKAVVKVKID